jgi:hypothetical protein
MLLNHPAITENATILHEILKLAEKITKTKKISTWPISQHASSFKKFFNQLSQPLLNSAMHQQWLIIQSAMQQEVQQYHKKNTQDTMRSQSLLAQKLHLAEKLANSKQELKLMQQTITSEKMILANTRSALIISQTAKNDSHAIYTTWHQQLRDLPLEDQHNRMIAYTNSQILALTLIVLEQSIANHQTLFNRTHAALQISANQEIILQKNIIALQESYERISTMYSRLLSTMANKQKIYDCMKNYGLQYSTLEGTLCHLKLTCNEKNKQYQKFHALCKQARPSLMAMAQPVMTSLLTLLFLNETPNINTAHNQLQTMQQALQDSVCQIKQQRAIRIRTICPDHISHEHIILLAFLKKFMTSLYQNTHHPINMAIHPTPAALNQPLAILDHPNIVKLHIKFKELKKNMPIMLVNNKPIDSPVIVLLSIVFLSIYFLMHIDNLTHHMRYDPNIVFKKEVEKIQCILAQCQETTVVNQPTIQTSTNARRTEFFATTSRRLINQPIAHRP